MEEKTLILFLRCILCCILYFQVWRHSEVGSKKIKLESIGCEMEEEVEEVEVEVEVGEEGSAEVEEEEVVLEGLLHREEEEEVGRVVLSNLIRFLSKFDPLTLCSANKAQTFS